MPPGSPPPAHDGAVLAFCADAKDGYLTGGDDGRLVRTAPDGGTTELANFGAMKWVEHVAAHESGLRAASVGKQLHLFGAKGEPLKTLPHPSAVGGIAFDAKGSGSPPATTTAPRSGSSPRKDDKPRVLEWKGSHAAIAISPDGTHVVTAMQENALHGWRLADGQHMRMSGYPSKTHFLSFTSRGKWLATSGADAVVVWPFFGGGPMGKAPTELAGGDGVPGQRGRLPSATRGGGGRLRRRAGAAGGDRLGQGGAGRRPRPWRHLGARLERHRHASRLRDGDGFAGLVDLSKKG